MTKMRMTRLPQKSPQNRRQSVLRGLLVWFPGGAHRAPCPGEHVPRPKGMRQNKVSPMSHVRAHRPGTWPSTGANMTGQRKWTSGRQRRGSPPFLRTATPGNGRQDSIQQQPGHPRRLSLTPTKPQLGEQGRRGTTSPQERRLTWFWGQRNRHSAQRTCVSVPTAAGPSRQAAPGRTAGPTPCGRCAAPA